MKLLQPTSTSLLNKGDQRRCKGWRLLNGQEPSKTVLESAGELCRFHEEPIIVGSGSLLTCLPASHDHSIQATEACAKCGTTRWDTKKDAFWLKPSPKMQDPNKETHDAAEPDQSQLSGKDSISVQITSEGKCKFQ